MKYKFIFLTFILPIMVSAQKWETNILDAKKIGTENNQNIILLFQGSDWCGPCIKLDKEIWSSSEFKVRVGIIVL